MEILTYIYIRGSSGSAVHVIYVGVGSGSEQFFIQLDYF